MSFKISSYGFSPRPVRRGTAKKAHAKVIEKEGLTYLDRFGQPATRPEVAVERDSRLAFFRCMRQLALSEEPPDDRPKPLKFGGRK